MALWAVGAPITTRSDEALASVQFGGQSVRPLSPVNLTAEQSDGELTIQWTRRSRQGFAWTDGMEAPLGEAQERYRVVVTGSAGTFEAGVEQPTIVLDQAVLATLGPGLASVEVRQIGDVAISAPASTSLTVS
jgi:hypothetical protein